MFSGRFACFKFVLVRVVAVLGCAWPPWLFYVASGVKGEIRLFQIVCVVFWLVFHSLQLFIGCLKTV